jgi:hypothetical protein
MTVFPERNKHKQQHTVKYVPVESAVNEFTTIYATIRAGLPVSDSVWPWGLLVWL